MPPAAAFTTAERSSNKSHASDIIVVLWSFKVTTRSQAAPALHSCPRKCKQNLCHVAKGLEKNRVNPTLNA